MNVIDRFLNSVTMYKLVLYGLIVISILGIILDYTRFYSLVTLVGVSYISNLFFGKIFRVSTNSESHLITALILFLIISPGETMSEFIAIALAGLISIGSKFIISPFRKHIFNPAAFGAFVVYQLDLIGITWWVGSSRMFLSVLIIGLLIVRKARRFDLLFTFLFTALLSIWYFHEIFYEVFLSWPLMFFGAIMLTEPITMPPNRILRITYGAIIGLLFGSIFKFGSLVPTPEFVLLIGNIFSYAISLKIRLKMILKEKSEVAKNIYEFVFIPDKKFSYSPGQYLEWTIPHADTDIRGNRRYFTIASSPTEEEIKLGVKINHPSSSFKRKLSSLNKGASIFSGQLAGDFILPKDINRKLVFIAGGIGVTPFRSMIKYLIDTNEKRDVFFLYAVKSEDEIAYRNLWIEADSKLGMKTEYVVGKFIDKDLIINKVEGWQKRVYYISGPDLMVRVYKKMLIKMGISRKNIRTDYFPGFT